MSIHTIAAAKAARILTAAGCQYAIITPSGDQIGDLEVCRPKRKVLYRNAEKFAYSEKVAAAAPGDTLVFESIDKGELDSLRRAVTGALIRRYGAGSAVSHMAHDDATGGYKLEVLVIGV